MATTWHGSTSSALATNFEANKAEENSPGRVSEVRRVNDSFEYRVTLPDGTKILLPVEAIVGGRRHGLSFLLRLQEIDGMRLDRSALLEGRYAYSTAQHALLLSPGFSPGKPSTYEDSAGNVLSPTFEQRCLTCHGEPNTLGAGKAGGVHCESCHGPSFGHLAAVGRGNPRESVINPKRLSVNDQVEVCAQCHTGFTYQSDPMPDDLLVSNQVNALRRAECFVQSGAKLSCTACHDPHDDSKDVGNRSVATCLGCHAASVKGHAAICPVNAKSECIGCHMPSIQKASFHMTDHWIRVHPEQRAAAKPLTPEQRSQIQPLREFLRLIVVPDAETAAKAGNRLAAGEAFSKVARDTSADPTAPGGGYLGDMELSQLDAKLAEAAGRLWYGQTSGVVNLGNRYIILSRLPRDFKWEANGLFQEASALKARGDWKGAVEKDQQALAVYPYFLRAMILMATTLGEAGDAARASEILRFAAQSYPKDASVEFNLGLTLRDRPAEQIAAFERAIELDPDMEAAYESLGATQYSAGRPQDAIQTFRKGLLINPLSAKLNYDLGLALKNEGAESDGRRRMALAAKADPQTSRSDQ
jgi:tetratricopeptide (TPR) repeat protein